MKWPLPRRPLQAMASLHHLSLGLQNATLGTFAGVGFRRFGLESCWGSAVSQPRTTELLGAVSELCSREFLADEVATSTGAAPGNGIIASSFFRSSERNVRHFCGRWFSQVWAWILLGFCCFATTLYWAPWGCFGAMLQKFLEGLRTQRKGVLRAMVLEGLGLNPGVVLALRNVKQFFGGLSWRLGRAALRRLPLLPWTSFAIRFLVFALYSPRSLPWQDLCATCGASMDESTSDNTVSNAKLLAAAPGGMNGTVANGAVDWCMAIWTCVFVLLARLALLRLGLLMCAPTLSLWKALLFLFLWGG